VPAPALKSGTTRTRPDGCAAAALRADAGITYLIGTAKPTGAAWQAFPRRLSFASADPARTLSLVEAIAAAERQVGGSPGEEACDAC
jgi:hypothetical protein